MEGWSEKVKPSMISEAKDRDLCYIRRFQCVLRKKILPDTKRIRVNPSNPWNPCSYYFFVVATIRRFPCSQWFIETAG